MIYKDNLKSIFNNFFKDLNINSNNNKTRVKRNLNNIIPLNNIISKNNELNIFDFKSNNNNNKKIYRKYLFKYHPDKCPINLKQKCSKATAIINKAYEKYKKREHYTAEKSNKIIIPPPRRKLLKAAAEAEAVAIAAEAEAAEAEAAEAEAAAAEAAAAAAAAAAEAKAEGGEKTTNSNLYNLLKNIPYPLLAYYSKLFNSKPVKNYTDFIKYWENYLKEKIKNPYPKLKLFFKDQLVDGKRCIETKTKRGNSGLLYKVSQKKNKSLSSVKKRKSQTKSQTNNQTHININPSVSNISKNNKTKNNGRLNVIESEIERTGNKFNKNFEENKNIFNIISSNINKINNNNIKNPLHLLEKIKKLKKIKTDIERLNKKYHTGSRVPWNIITSKKKNSNVN